MTEPSRRAALLFDLDGTLVHSDPIHTQVFIEFFAARGIEIDEDYYLRRIHGRQNAEIFAEHCPGEDADALSEAKEAAFRDRLGRNVPLTPGITELLAKARAEGWGTAVVTNAPRVNAEAMLAATGLSDAFDTLVIGDECSAGKPDPAPYTTAMDRLGAAPELCIAFEDSGSGLRSAAAAGAFAVGIRSSLSEDTLRAAGAQVTAQDFNDPVLAPALAQLSGART